MNTEGEESSPTSTVFPTFTFAIDSSSSGESSSEASSDTESFESLVNPPPSLPRVTRKKMSFHYTRSYRSKYGLTPADNKNAGIETNPLPANEEPSTLPANEEPSTLPANEEPLTFSQEIRDDPFSPEDWERIGNEADEEANALRSRGELPYQSSGSPQVEQEVLATAISISPGEAYDRAKISTREEQVAEVGATLARGLKSGTVQKGISESLQKEWDTNNENSDKYEGSKNRNFQRMLDILIEHGGEQMRNLACTLVYDGCEEVPLLIDVLRNVKDCRYFLVILDECLKFFVEFARQKNGEPYSCGSMQQMLKQIFATLNKKYHLHVKDSDFGARGTFRGRLSRIWTLERNKDPTFGQQKGMSDICLDDIFVVHDALADGTLKPDQDAYHLKLLISFCLLRFFGLRTAEASDLDIKNVRWGSYRVGPDKGKAYVELYVDINKVRKLKLKEWKIPPNYGKIKVRDNPEDEVFNVYYWLKFYQSKLPNQEGRYVF